MIFSGLEQITATAFAGTLNNVDLLASIGICFPFITFLNAVGQMVGVGTSSLLGRKLGENSKDIKKEIGASFFYGLLFYILVLILCFCFLKGILIFLGAKSGTYGYTEKYITILIIGAVFPIFNMIFANLFRMLGKPYHSLFLMAISAVFDILLILLLVFGFKTSIIGFALSFVISQMFGTIFSIAVFIRQKLFNLKFNINNLKNIIKGILSIGLPTLVMQICTSVSLSFLNSAAANISKEAVAGFSIGNKIYMLGFGAVLGYTQAFLPYAAYNYGSKDYKKLKKSLAFSVIATSSLCAFFTIIFICFPNNISAVFSGNKSVINYSSKSLVAHSIPFVLVAVIQTFTVFFQAVKKPVAAGALSIVRQGILLIPASVAVLYIFKKYIFIIYAQPVCDVLTFLFLSVMLIIYKFKNKKTL